MKRDVVYLLFFLLLQSSYCFVAAGDATSQPHRGEPSPTASAKQDGPVVVNTTVDSSSVKVNVVPTSDDDDDEEPTPQHGSDSPSISPPKTKDQGADSKKKGSGSASPSAGPETIPPLDYEKWVEDTVKKTLGSASLTPSHDEGGGVVLDDDGEEDGDDVKTPARPDMTEQNIDTYHQEQDHYRDHIRRSRFDSVAHQENLEKLAKAIRIQDQLDGIDREMGVKRAQLHHKQNVRMSAVMSARNKKCKNLPGFWYHAISSPSAGGSPNFFPKPDPPEVDEAVRLLQADAARMKQDPSRRPTLPQGESGSVIEEVRGALDAGHTLITDHELFGNYLANIQCFHIPAEARAKEHEARNLLSQSVLRNKKTSASASASTDRLLEELPDWMHRTIVVSADDDDGFDTSIPDDGAAGDDGKVLTNVKQTAYLDEEAEEVTPGSKNKKNKKHDSDRKEIPALAEGEEEVALPAELQYGIPSESLHHRKAVDEDRYRLVLEFQETPTSPSKTPLRWQERVVRPNFDGAAAGGELRTLTFENELVGSPAGDKPTPQANKKKASLKYPLRETILVKDVAVAAAQTFNQQVHYVDPETGEPKTRWRNAGLGEGTHLSLSPRSAKAKKSAGGSSTSSSDESKSSTLLKKGFSLVNHTVLRMFMHGQEFEALPDGDQADIRGQLHWLLQRFCVHSTTNDLSSYESDILKQKYERKVQEDRAMQQAHHDRVQEEAEGYRLGNKRAEEDLGRKRSLKEEDEDL